MFERVRLQYFAALLKHVEGSTCPLSQRNKFSTFLAARKGASVEVDLGSVSKESSATQSRSHHTGKRHDPAFEQVTAYIRRNTHHEVKLALLKEGDNRQFNDLVEALLSRWLMQSAYQSELPDI